MHLSGVPLVIGRLRHVGVPAQRSTHRRCLRQGGARRRLTRIGLHDQWGVRVGALVILLALWYAISALGSLNPLYLPSPAALWHAFLRANSDHTVAVLDLSTVCATEDHMTSPEDLRAYRSSFS